MKIQQKIRQYFQAKTKEILALSEQALSDHSGLIGNHREGILCDFLGEFFPKRYAIDKGIVYGLIGQSKEADIVIWDELNYLKLKQKGSNIFFVQGVKAIVEVKSRWSNHEFEDIKVKVKSAIEILGSFREGISGRIESLEASLWSLKSGNDFHGRVITPNKKGTVAIIFYGGSQFDIQDLDSEEIGRIEDEYPDILFFLEAGKLILKSYESNKSEPHFGCGILEQLECGDDALLVFTSSLIDLLANKSEHLEPPLFLTDYVFDLFGKFDVQEVVFPLSKPIEGRSKFIYD